jgi:hypothetical protein
MAVFALRPEMAYKAHGKASGAIDRYGDTTALPLPPTPPEGLTMAHSACIISLHGTSLESVLTRT